MSEVVEKIAAEIALHGAIPFARFMELALYCPVYGYYEKEKDTLGRHGDYYTSVSVGSLFGELLACQFAQWLQQPGPGQGAQLVEAGAHDGTLARDILTWLQEHQPELFDRLQYVIIEPSERRQAWQKHTLAEFTPKIRWLAEISTLATLPPGRRVIFSNELLDAMPVHRLGWDAQHQLWFEWGVTLQDNQFTWSPLPAPPFLAPPLPTPLLPHHYTLELCPAAQEWWRQAATALGSGKLVAIDYGLTQEELWVPERTNGTLRAYHRHQSSSDLLAAPGEQDLTAHVNFTAVEAAGESAGLKTEEFVTQGQFLTRIAAQVLEQPAAFGPWSRQHTRQFQTLTHPEHLGRAFRVLVQSGSSLKTRSY